MVSSNRARALILALYLTITWVGSTEDALAATPVNSATAKTTTSVASEPKISLEFRDVSLDSVLQLFSMASGKTVIKDPAVTGNITLLGKRDASLTEALALLQEALQARSAVVRVSDNIIEVMPASRARNSSAVVGVGETLPTDNSIITYILPIRGMNASALQTQLMPLFSSDTAIAANNETNTLIITDYASHVARVVEIVRELQDSYDSLVASRKAEQDRAAAMSRENASRAATQLADRMQGVQNWPQVQVIKLQYADARTLSTELRQILRGSESSSTQISSDMLQRLRSQGINTQQADALLRELTSRGQSNSPGASTSQSSSTSTAPILENRVIADTHSNALIVTGTPQVIKTVADLVKILDVEINTPQSTYELRVFPLQNADPRSIAQLLNDLATQAARKFQAGQKTGSIGNVSPQSRSAGISPDMQQLRESFQALADSNNLRNLSPAERNRIAEQLRKAMPNSAQNQWPARSGANTPPTTPGAVGSAPQTPAADQATPSTTGDAATVSVVPGTALVSGNYLVAADTQSSSLIVMAEPIAMAEIARLVTQLDVAASGEEMTTQVVSLQHADATNLASILNQFLSGSGRSGSTTANPMQSLIRSQLGGNAASRLQSFMQNRGNAPQANLRPGRINPMIGGANAGASTGASAIIGSQSGSSLVAAQGSVRIVAEPSTNSLLIIAPKDAINDLQELISDLDRDDLSNSVVTRVLPVEHGSAQSIASVVSQFYSNLAAMAQPNTSRNARSSAPSVRIVADTSTNLLLIVVSKEKEQEVVDLIATLDQAAQAAADSAVVWVRQMQFADASNVASIINQYLRGVTSVGISAPVQSASAQQALTQLRLQASNQASGQRSANTGNMAGRSPAGVTAGGTRANQSVSSVVVVPDTRSNRILISVPEDLAEQVRQLLDELDEPSLSAEYVTRQYSLEGASALAVAQTLTQFFSQTALDSQGNVTPATNTGGKGQPIQVRAVAGPSGDVLFVLVPKAIAESVDELVANLDRLPAGSAPIISWVQQLRFADANNLAQVLSTYLRGTAASLTSTQPSVNVQSGTASANTRNAAQTANSARTSTQATRSTTPSVSTSVSGGQNVWIVSEPASRSLLISVPQTMEEQVRSLIEMLDREDLASRYTVVRIELQQADATSLAQTINQTYTGLVFASDSGLVSRTQGNQSIGWVRAVADRVTNSLLLALPVEAKESVQALVKELDKPASNGEQIVQVVRLQHVSGSSMATVLNQLTQGQRSQTIQSAQSSRSTTTNAGSTGRTGSQTTQPMTRNISGSTASPVSDWSNVWAGAGPDGSSLVVSAPAEFMPVVLDMITQLDHPPVPEETKQVDLAYVSASSAANLVSQLLQARTAQQRAMGSEVRAVADTVNNRVLLIGPGALVAEAEKIVREMDQPVAADLSGNIGVYRVQNARAVDLANVLNSLFSSTSTTPGKASTEPSVRGTQQAASSQTVTQNTPDQRSPESWTGNLAYEKVRTIADQPSNTLLIIGPPEVMPEVRSIAASLDVMPPQVLIEAVVVEMSLDSNSDMGIQWKWANPHNDATTSNSGSIGLGNLMGELGAKYSLLTNGLEAAISAISGDSKMNVISTPRILAANDTPATINIVTQIPYIQSERTEGTGANKTVTNTWAYKDVGVVLEVTPRIGESGKVYLDLYQTTDSFTQDTMSGKPIINTRKTQSTLVVQDGQTLVMGGLIRDNESMAIQKVPLLGDLPIIGHFFRTNKKVNSKTELVVFVRPTIVRTQADAEALTTKEAGRIQAEALQKAGVPGK